jgi:hypothetical protein
MKKIRLYTRLKDNGEYHILDEYSDKLYAILFDHVIAEIARKQIEDYLNN